MVVDEDDVDKSVMKAERDGLRENRVHQGTHFTGLKIS